MAELKVYSSIGVRSAAEAAAPKIRGASGHKLAVTWGTAPMLVKRIEGGEAADVVILSRAGIDTLRKQGKIALGSDVTLAGSAVAIAVKAGAPKPDISTPEALKQTLLQRKIHRLQRAVRRRRQRRLFCQIARSHGHRGAR